MNAPATRLPWVVSSLVRGMANIISPAGPRARLSILIYHRVLACEDPLLGAEPDVVEFTWQMQVVKEHFNVLPLMEAVERLQQGSLPDRAACITFDDGYADNVKFALPILMRMGIPATFFVATGFLDGGCMWNDLIIEAVRRVPGTRLDLTRSELGVYSIASMAERQSAAMTLLSLHKYLHPKDREIRVRALVDEMGVELPNNLMMRSEEVIALDRAGMEIGAHTVNHPILTAIPDNEARHEIAAGKEHLSGIIGRAVRIFAYPNGKPGRDYEERHVRMAVDLGFTAAVSTAWGAARCSTDVFQLPRFTPWDKTPSRFGLRMVLNYLRR